MALEFSGKNVLIVDGELANLTQMTFLLSDSANNARFYCTRHDFQGNRADGQRCGRKEGHCCKLLNFLNSFSNVYGIDMPSRMELVAHKRDTESIAEAIGADLVIFQTLPDLISAVRQFNPSITSFDCSVFTGEYVTGGVDEEYLSHLERLRADNTAESKVLVGGIGTMEGKGGGGIKHPANGAHHNSIVTTSSPLNGAMEHRNVPTMNGADDTVGLYNSWAGPR